MHICASQFSKFPRGSMPPDPLEGARAGPRRDRVAITSFGVLEFHAPPWLKSWIRHWYGERIGAEELGLSAVDTSPWVGIHTCTPQVASFDSTSDTKQWLCSTTQHDSLLWEHTCTAGFTVPAVNGNDGAAFNFTDSRASSQTWSAMAHWLFTTERVRMNEWAERVSDGRQERTVNLTRWWKEMGVRQDGVSTVVHVTNSAQPGKLFRVQ